MEKLSNPTVEYLKEVAWAVFMIDVIIVSVGAALSGLAGWSGAFVAFLFIAAGVDVIFAVILLGNWLIGAVIRLASRSSRRL